jgi:hypothetical protein
MAKVIRSMQVKLRESVAQTVQPQSTVKKWEGSILTVARTLVW